MDPVLITSPTDGRHRVYDPVRDQYVGPWEPDRIDLAQRELRRITARVKARAAKAAKAPPHVVGPFVMRTRAEALTPADTSRPFAQEFAHGWLVWNPVTQAWTGRPGLGAFRFEEVGPALERVAQRMNEVARGGA